MDAQENELNWNALGSGVLSIAAGLLVVMVLGGRTFSPIADGRAAFYAMSMITFAMCLLGMRNTVNRLGWMHPLTILGSVIGALLVALVVGVLLGWQLPLIHNDRDAFLALAVLTFAKWVLSWIGRLFFHAWAPA